MNRSIGPPKQFAAELGTTESPMRIVTCLRLESRHWVARSRRGWSMLSARSLSIKPIDVPAVKPSEVEAILALS